MKNYQDISSSSERKIPRLLRNIGIKPVPTIIFFILHIAISMTVVKVPDFSIAYAIFILIIGVWAALSGREKLVICVAGYIVGAEVLWRMSRTTVFWELGKYGVIAILILAMFTGKREKTMRPWNLILYFLFLIPMVFLTSFESFKEFSNDVSFNMSGPLSLLVCGLYFSGLILDKRDLRRIFTWLITPVLSISWVALTAVRHTDIIWGTYSSKVASGGFGPNQVSGILGFSAFLCIVLIVLTKKELVIKFLLGVLSLWFLTQALLTFSRSGPIQAVMSTVIFFLVLIKSKKRRYFSSSFVLGIVIILLITYYVLPSLDRYTGGALGDRYAEQEEIAGIKIVGTTGRLAIFQADLKAFSQNLSGVGLGKSHSDPDLGIKEGILTHTEWSRMLAEHGILGLLSILFLFIWMWGKYKLAKEDLSRAIFLGIVFYAVVYMGGTAMRTVLPGFLIGFLGADLKIGE